MGSGCGLAPCEVVGRGNPSVNLARRFRPAVSIQFAASRRGLPSKTVGALLIQDGSTSHKWEADLMQAAYFVERLGYLRFDAEASRAMPRFIPLCASTHSISLNPRAARMKRYATR